MKNKNPFLDAIPKRLSERTFFEKIMSIPVLNKALPDKERIAQLTKIIYGFFQPLSKHFHLYEKVQMVLESSYEYRTPDKLLQLIKTAKNICPKTAQSLILEHARDNVTIQGFGFIGIGGLGKTTILKKILKLFPQVIFHKEFNLTQVVHLRFNVPNDGKTTTLSLNFFSALDEVLGPDSDYYNDYKGLDQVPLLRQMRIACAYHFIGLLLVDEIQDLKGNTALSIANTMRYLKSLSNDLNVPVILIGTPDANKIVFGNWQNATRTTGIGLEKWNVMKFDDPEWDLLIESLFSINNLKKKQNLTNELKYTYYRLSLGVPRLLNSLHMMSVKYAISNGTELITPETVTRVSQDNQYATLVMVSGILENNSAVLNVISDLSMAGVETTEGLLKDESETVYKYKWSTAKLMSKNLYPDLNDHELNSIVNTLIENHPEIKIDEIVSKIDKMVVNLTPKAQPSTPKEVKTKGIPKGELIELCRNSKDEQDNYQMLKEAGYIPNLLEILEL